MKAKASFFLWLVSYLNFAQSPNGYWDNQRATTKEITLSAGEKVVLKSEEFPVGTTEFAYRITLLDENQKMVNDLASVLKAIPDPYFIGKGTGGALSLVSSISGSDKCTYAVFVDEKLANNFVNSEKIEKACLYQKNPVSKDAKVVGLKSTCLHEDTKQLWFAFKNQNWLMGEKIILEIVPWVDNIASRGWTKKNKESLVTQFSANSISQSLNQTQRNKFVYKLIDKIALSHRFQDFKNLSATEQNLVIESYEEQALVEIGLPNYYNDYISRKAKGLADKGAVEQAIEMMKNKVVSKLNATALNYNVLGELYLMSNQFEKAFQSFQNAEKLDPSELKVKMNLAHTYMFMDEVSKSKEIHKKYTSQNISANQTWKNKVINDLARFEKMQNLPQENIKKIWRLFN
ncbi:tetratricopeptide repeat protein [Flavobacterium sp.]|uniref:tetratricopeptide repeat protein n=1 Tax=Flavobacterium sp. TaxID=239 RepID=UPI003D106E74